MLDPAVYDRVRPVTVPRDLELSASALLEYDTCPRSFYYHYFRHMPGIDLETVGEGSRRISAIDLGTYVHRVLELLQEEPEEEALAEALEVLDRTGAEKKVFAREGRKLVEQYCASPPVPGTEGPARPGGTGFRPAPVPTGAGTGGVPGKCGQTGDPAGRPAGGSWITKPAIRRRSGEEKRRG